MPQMLSSKNDDCMKSVTKKYDNNVNKTEYMLGKSEQDYGSR